MLKTYIIAEAGVNHNGCLDTAMRLADIASDAGADAVKFQTFKADKLASKLAPKAVYQMVTTDVNESQLEMIRRLELDEAAHRQIIEHCRLKHIQFLSTPFDLESVSLLVDVFDIPRLKLSSGEITNAPLLLKVSRTGKPVILSTGMSTLGEIEMALGILAFGYMQCDENPSLSSFKTAYCSKEGQSILQQKVVLMHCTSEYPAPYVEVNLRAMDTLRASFGLSVGLSDHTPGITVPIAAVARGASIIEKHFTLDRNLPGPDHKASLDPNELMLMVKSIRQVEDALGSSLKIPTASEFKNVNIARKSLVASADIKRGEVFTAENIGIKRPGYGISPMYYWEFIGKIAQKDYREDEVIA